MSIFQPEQAHLGAEEGEGEGQAQGGINYGNLIVISKRGMHISIGPDYPFTIVALIFLCILSYALYIFQAFLQFQTAGRLVNLLFVLAPPVSFMFTALSNPGVYDYLQNDQPKVKYCQLCRVFKPGRVQHCERCNICVQGYDHHCPWLSKCVGRKNLVSFYIFVASVPSSFFYFGYLMYTAITLQVQRHPA